MTKKLALFAFNGDPMCFSHVLLNAMDMHEKGHQVKVVIEGSATKLIKSFEEDGEGPIAQLFFKVRDMGMLDCACNACSLKMGSQDSAKRLEIRLCDEMMGHPSISRYIDEGYDVLTF